MWQVQPPVRWCCCVWPRAWDWLFWPSQSPSPWEPWRAAIIMRLMSHLAPWWRWSCFGPGCKRLRAQRLKHILSALDRKRISPTLLSLRVGRPSGWLDPRGWTNPTLADRSEARVDHLVNRPGPVVSSNTFTRCCRARSRKRACPPVPCLSRSAGRWRRRWTRRSRSPKTCQSSARVAWP